MKEFTQHYNIYFYPFSDNPIEENTNRLKRADLITVELTEEEYRKFLDNIASFDKIINDKQIIITGAKLHKAETKQSRLYMYIDFSKRKCWDVLYILETKYFIFMKGAEE